MEFEEEKSGPSSAYGDGKGTLQQSGSGLVSSPLESSNIEDLKEGKTILKVTGKSGYVSISIQ